MLAGKRAVRVGEQLQKTVALLLLEKVRDPRVSDVTITGLRMSDDLKLARIYYSVLNEKEGFKSAQEGLDSARGFIKREIGLRLSLRYVPEIIFIHDDSLETGHRMDRLLEELESDGSQKIDK